jgi:hypothetical protein
LTFPDIARSANVSNFNWQFKTAKETTPAAYRREFAEAGVPDDEDVARLTERSPSLQRERERIGSENEEHR